MNRYFSSLIFLCYVSCENSTSVAALPNYYQKLLAQTVERSPELKIKRKNLEQKKYYRWSARAAWLPRLDWQISMNRTNANLYTGQIDAETDYKQSALALSAPIYRRSVHLSFLQTDADLAVATEDYLAAEVEQDWKLQKAVGTLLISVYKLAATNKSLEVTRKIAKETTIRFNTGSRSQLDVLKSQAQLTLLESQILSVQNEIQKNQDTLLEMTGLSLDELRDLSFPLHSEDELSLGRRLDELTVSSGHLYETSKVIERFEKQGRLKKNAELNLESAKIKAAMISAKDWPDLAFKATYQKNTQEWDQLNQANESHNFGLTLTIPLFNFGSGYSAHREAKAAEAVAQIQSDQILNEARHKVLHLAEQVKVLTKLVQAQELRRNQSLELERLTGKSYEYGKSTIQDFLSTQNETLNAKIDLAKTRLDLVIAEKQLDWNLGRLD